VALNPQLSSDRQGVRALSRLLAILQNKTVSSETLVQLLYLILAKA